jgi:hypothetical protein
MTPSAWNANLIPALAAIGRMRRGLASGWQFGWRIR